MHLAFACSIACGVACTSNELTTTRQAIVGGDPDTLDLSVAAVTIQGGRCSGVAVAPRVVMTAAHCAVAGVSHVNPGTVDFGDVVPSAATANIIDIWIDRQFDTSRADHDVALLRIDRDAPSVSPLAPLFEGTISIRAVGYGETTPGQASTYGTRRSLVLLAFPSSSAATSIVLSGSPNASTCTGDSGGAVFAEDLLIGVVSSGTAACDGDINVAVPGNDDDVHTVISSWSGPCPADGTCNAACIDPAGDPDCDPCRFEGTCQKGCATPDLDCPVDGGLGATCVLADECETRVCIPAPEGADRGSYCSASCTTTADCMAPLDDCEGGVCVYPDGTPGIPGAACAKDADCRTLLCDDGTHTCAVQCGPDYGCPAGLLCSPVRNARACTGGDACNAGGGGGVATCIAILVIAGIGRQTRRRRR